MAFGFGLCNYKWSGCSNSPNGMHKCQRPKMHIKNKSNDDHWCGNTNDKDQKCNKRLATPGRNGTNG